jgi:hypothetical protein
MTAPTKPATRTVGAGFNRETKQFARFDLDEPYTGSIYVPLDQWTEDGKPIKLTLSIAATP